MHLAPDAAVHTLNRKALTSTWPALRRPGHPFLGVLSPGRAFNGYNWGSEFTKSVHY